MDAIAYGSDYDKEHVTPYIWRNNRCQNVNFGIKDHRNFSVDTREDLQFVNEIVEKFGPDVTLEEASSFLSHSEHNIVTGNLVG